MTMIIYKAENTDTKKVYIGMSKFTIEKRKQDHQNKCKYDQASEFYKDLFNSQESFKWEVIEKLDTYEEAVLAERKWINEYNSYFAGYNRSLGQGTLGIEYSDESKKKMSERKQGMKCYKAILTDDDVMKIKSLLKTTKMRQWEIAKLFGVTQMTVSKIHTGDTWKHLA